MPTCVSEGVTAVCDPATDCSAGLHHCWASHQDIRNPQRGLPEASAHCTLILCQVMQAAQLRRPMWMPVVCIISGSGSTGVPGMHASLLNWMPMRTTRGPSTMLRMAVSICRSKGCGHIVKLTMLQLRRARNTCICLADSDALMTRCAFCMQ